jgi:hypothetical protein
MGSIDHIELRPASDPSKFDQLMVQYLVIDGEHTGRKSSEFLSLSPRATFRLKRWFDHFGLSDELTGLDIDDDTNLLNDPDLVGVNVIFKVFEDAKLYQGERRVRTELVEVLDEEPAPAPAPVRRVAPAPARPAARPAPAPAPVEEVEEDEEVEAEEVEEVAPAPAPRRFAPRPAAPAAAPARRQLK